MIRYKDISIPKPCSVDYDALPGDEVKHFCGSCEKQVYDFRGKDEAYFNSIINRYGKVCGIFHKDDIQATTLKIKHPFYHVFAAKLIGVGLFLKTLLNSHDVEASTTYMQATTQQSTDSTGVKVEIKNRDDYYLNYSIDIFINNTLYKSGNNLDKNTGYIGLPDSLIEHDKIKVVIHRSKIKSHTEIHRVKKRTYNFTYIESNKITIQITNTQKAILIKKRRPQAAGYYFH